VATTWDITFGSMPVGIYRVDLILDDKNRLERFLQNHRLKRRVFSAYLRPRIFSSQTRYRRQ